MPRYGNTIDTLFDNVIKTDGGCLLYTKSNTEHYHGYAKISYKNKKWQAHRLAYTLFIGNIPKNKIVMHTCDNRNCINPAHLCLGTNKENSEDMVNKQRQYRPIGEKNVQAKLTESAVRRIKWNLDGECSDYWANVYCVSKTTILRIWNNKTWRHI